MNTSEVNCRRCSATRALGLTGSVAIPCVSALIALIWAVQFMVSVPLSLITRGIKQSWPIVDYPMYSDPHFAGEEIPRLAVVGIGHNAKEIDILPEDIGGGYWHFQIFAKAVRDANKKVIQDVVQTYETRHKVRLVALRVEDRPLRWNNVEIEAAPMKVLRDYRLDTVQHSETVP
jgi:hypothetical protein